MIYKTSTSYRQSWSSNSWSS